MKTISKSLLFSLLALCLCVSVVNDLVPMWEVSI